MTKTVAIYGGGIAGTVLAHALKNDAEVTIVSPLDYFEIPMAMPRLLVEPGFAARSVVPFARMAPGIRHVQGHLVSFGTDGGVVETPDGERLDITADVSVLATGSRYANSLTRAQTGSAADRREELGAFNARLTQARRVVIVGGGPIGIEVAGEITREHPDKRVTVVEGNTDILNGTSRKVAAHAQKVLERRGVTFHLGERVVEPAWGAEPEGGVARTENGLELPFDLIFWAVGSRPNTGYVPKDLLTEDGRIPVDAHLRVKGMQNVFALGDVTDLKEVKKAIYINGHVRTAARNIRSALSGRPPKATYKAQTGNDIMVVTLGRQGGVAHLPGLGTIRANWMVRMAKAGDMLVGMYRKKVGARSG